MSGLIPAEAWARAGCRISENYKPEAERTIALVRGCPNDKVLRQYSLSMKKIFPVLFAISFLLGLGGCSTVDQKASFNEVDFQPYLASGRSAVFGHAFVRTPNGVKHTAAGLPVRLVPLTPYTEERAEIMLAGKTPSPADPRMDKYVRTEVADMGGQFAFGDLPAGSYLVFCKIEWFGGRYGGVDYFAVAKATVAAGQRKHVVATRLDQ